MHIQSLKQLKDSVFIGSSYSQSFLFKLVFFFFRSLSTSISLNLCKNQGFAQLSITEVFVCLKYLYKLNLFDVEQLNFKMVCFNRDKRLGEKNQTHDFQDALQINSFMNINTNSA